MARRCFRKKGSNPPVCGVHQVPLTQKESSDDSDTSRFGNFTYLACPVSGQVLNDE
jgi:hypothetical protein